MADELEPWGLKTQQKLGAVIKVPKLQDKLLRKPPFRFLHDIVTSFMKTTNLLGGLYSPDELDSAKVTEKEAKVQFLQKLITVVQIATGQQIEAKPSKIIAGAEPEQTNEMLQALADLASVSPPKVDEAVKRVVLGDSAPAAAAPAPKPEPARPAAAVDPPPRQAPPAAATTVPAVTPLVANNNDAAAAARPGTATARKPPPAVKSNEVVEERGEAATKAVPAAGVIVDRGRAARQGPAGDEEEEKKEETWEQIVERQELEAQKAAAGSADGAAAKGYLANQALQAKQAQEEAAKKAQAEAEKQNAERGDSGIVLKTRGTRGAEKGGAMGDSEFSKLREQLQLLTKASNPLGRFLEAIHDDIDTMSRELEMWRTEARTQAAASTDAQRQTQEALVEAKQQLSSIDDAIKDQLQKTSILRAKILQNDKIIESLVRMVVQSDARQPGR